MDRKIKVMVVDDSALMRKIISDMINAEVDMEVIDTAKKWRKFIKQNNTTVPDVITLDVEMPIMDGITTLKKLKELKISSKIIMLSSLTKDGAEKLQWSVFKMVPLILLLSHLVPFLWI